MGKERSYDSDSGDEGEERSEAYFVIERPIEELATFQSHIYSVYSPIVVQERIVTDDISHRMYFGHCQNCSEEHYLGTLVTQCDEPVKLYARVK